MSVGSEPIIHGMTQILPITEDIKHALELYNGFSPVFCKQTDVEWCAVSVLRGIWGKNL